MKQNITLNLTLNHPSPQMASSKPKSSKRVKTTRRPIMSDGGFMRQRRLNMANKYKSFFG